MVHVKMHTVFLSLVLCVASFIIFGVQSRQLPSYFPRCYRDRPQEEINECMLKATEIVRPYLKKGVPELKIPSISPLTIPEISLEQGTTSTSYKAYAKNVSLYGLDTYIFRKNEFNPKTLAFFCDVNMPVLAMRGTYVVEGKFLNAPLQGQGIFYSNITNSNGTLDIQAKLVTRKNVQYMEIEKMVTKLDVGKVVDYGLEGLFSDNEILAKATQNALRENLPLVVEELKPAIELLMTRLFRDVILNAILKIPYDEVYPISKK
ncbi:unnamed protein product [Brassicogethes aeneus]|uniref:Uncharacterized protein n=1 Tax=Brassicogethes aeneus TaxID=1431903 RepID=A0A9P0FK37_BRAAE|nr:unnamed protein product [Brassicogethes aeneus]